MLKIKLLPAGYGDCILISIDSVENVNILIDGGLSETYDKYLKKEGGSCKRDPFSESRCRKKEMGFP